MLEAVRDFESALLGMDIVRCRSVLNRVSAEDSRIQTLEWVVVTTLERIGLAWEEGRIALAQVYMSGRLCEEALASSLLSLPTKTSTGPRIALAVLEDQHQLGKRIVGSVLRSAGYQVVDLGQGMDAEELARRFLADPVPLLMVSVLMLHAALQLRPLRAALSRAGASPALVAGGAPFRFDATLPRTVGVDAAGTSAMDALRFAHRYVGDPCHP